MGVKEERAIRNLLVTKSTAGRIMTSESFALPATETAACAIDAIRELDDDFRKSTTCLRSTRRARSPAYCPCAL